MQEKIYKEFDEKVYSTTLSNGLRVDVLPKKSFTKTYAVLTSDFGSIDQEVILNGEKLNIPAGTAHFLEHKLFEKEDYDAFELFTKNGADANAFTSYSKTSYLFSTIDQLHENLDNLLDFVCQPYFSEKSVQKEQGIIGQEIQMYNDDADWQLYMGILKNLYPSQPLSADIAGSIDSIAKITPDLLYKIHQVFYRPSNLHLLVAGPVDVDEIIQWVTDNQNHQKDIDKFEFEIQSNPQASSVVLDKQLELDVNRPKLMIGINNNRYLPEDGVQRLAYLVELEMAFYLIFSSSSKTYLNLYDNGLLDDTFGYEINSERNELFMTMGGDTSRVDELSDTLKDILSHPLTATTELLEDFELAKREMFGRNIMKLNSLEAVANSFEGPDFGYTNIYDETKLYANLNLESVLLTYNNFIKDVEISTFKIISK